TGARQYQPGSEAGRVSLHRRPFGMWQVHAVAPDRGPAAADLGKGAGGWHAGEWAGNRSHPDLPGTRPVSVADGWRERRVRHEDEERPESLAQGEGAVLFASCPSFEIQGQLYPSTIWRHAATSRIGAGTGHRARRPADGRAVWGAGRSDSRSAARRIGAHLGRNRT